MKHQLFPAILIMATVAYARAERYVQKHSLSKQLVAVVAEGDFEPRSMGSYSVRMYEVLNPDFPTDNFVCGIVAERDGSVERVIVHDLDGKGMKEVIVTIRCVGTGSYLSAHAYRYEDGALTLAASFESLPKDTDSLLALKRQLGTN